MTDKEKLDAIRAEIHRLVDVRGYDREMANDLFTFMDSLPNEPVSEELEEIAWNHADKKCHLDIAVFTPDEVKKERGKMQFTWQDLYDAVMFGANWQKEQDQSTIELAEDHAMLAGMEKMKEEMMTKSIEAVVSQVPCSNEIILYNPSSVDRYYLPQEMNKLGLNKGDKVKLIIIKDD